MSDEFYQGDIVWFNFPFDPKQPQYTIRGRHPALILHDYTHSNKTLILSPLSSLYDDNGNKKELKSYHLVVYKEDYPALANDSYVKLDQIMTFSRHRSSNELICKLNEKDLAACHLKLIESLQMHDTIREITQKQIEIAVHKALKEYIQDLLKES